MNVSPIPTQQQCATQSDSENEDAAFKPNPYQAVADAQVRSGAWPGTPLLMSRPTSPNTPHFPDGMIAIPFELGQVLAGQPYQSVIVYAGSNPCSEPGSPCSSPHSCRYHSHQGASNIMPIAASMMIQPEFSPGSNPSSVPGSRCASPSATRKYCGSSSNQVMGIPVVTGGHAPGNASPCFVSVSSPDGASSPSWTPLVCVPVVIIASTSTAPGSTMTSSLQAAPQVPEVRPTGQNSKTTANTMSHSANPTRENHRSAREIHRSTLRRAESPVEGQRRRRLGHHLTTELRDSVSHVVQTVNTSSSARGASPCAADSQASGAKLPMDARRSGSKQVVYLRPEFQRLGSKCGWKKSENTEIASPQKDNVTETAQPCTASEKMPLEKLADRANTTTLPPSEIKEVPSPSAQTEAVNFGSREHRESSVGQAGDTNSAWSFVPEISCNLGSKANSTSSRRSSSSVRSSSASVEVRAPTQNTKLDEQVPVMPTSASLEPKPLTEFPTMISEPDLRLHSSIDFDSLQSSANPKKMSHSGVPKNVDIAKEFGAPCQETQVTTLMIRNIPNTYTRTMLSAELDNLGFVGRYDFLYLPIDKSTSWNVGYSFVNFLDASIAYSFRQITINYKFSHASHHGVHKPILVSVAHIQGLKNNMKHYTNTAVECARAHNQRPMVLAIKSQPKSKRRTRQHGNCHEKGGILMKGDKSSVGETGANAGDTIIDWSFLAKSASRLRFGRQTDSASPRRSRSSSNEMRVEAWKQERNEIVMQEQVMQILDMRAQTRSEKLDEQGPVMPTSISLEAKQSELPSSDSPIVIAETDLQPRMVHVDVNTHSCIDFEILQSRAVEKKLSHSSVPKNVDIAKIFGDPCQEAQVTTLMIRNIPNTYTRTMLSAELDNLGFVGRYDFLYLPIDKSTSWNVGYSFVNFLDASIAYCFRQITINYKFSHASHQGIYKPMLVSVARIQGLESNLNYYSNTAVQCARVLNQRPLILARKSQPKAKRRPHQHGNSHEKG